MGSVIIHCDGSQTAHTIGPAIGQDRGFFQSYLSEFDRLERIASQIGKTSLNLNISFGNGKDGAETEWVGLSDEKFSALVHRLRPFILANEPYFFFRVAARLKPYLESDQLRAMQKELGNHFRGKNVMHGMDFHGVDPALHSDSVLGDYLNAREFHRDQDKLEKLYRDGGTMYAIRQYSAFEALHQKLEAISFQAGVCLALSGGSDFGFRLKRVLPKREIEADL